MRGGIGALAQNHTLRSASDGLWFTIMAFPLAFIQRLRDHFTLESVIGSRIQLRKSGREWVARCPFHNEKSGSFRVYTDHYHCYGCNAHGDIFEFIKQYERMNYAEAVERLATEAGIPMPEFSPAQAQKAKVERSLYEVMEEATKFFERMLLSGQGLAARQYVERRTITRQTQTLFRLGYAPDSRDSLKRSLLAAGFSEQHLVVAGLLATPEQGSTYDRFRGRLMFPIRDTSGRVIAFGGRILQQTDGKQAAKYLNSPETPLFKKGETVYNLQLAGKTAKEQNTIVLVEGYMDVIAVYQAGFHAVVAPLGTAITAAQLKRLWQYAESPTLCLDGDTAGMRASLRAAELALPLLSAGKSMKFAHLPKGEDPDSVIGKFGLDYFSQALDHAKDIYELLWQATIEEYPGTSPAARSGLEKKLMQLADAVQDAVLRTHARSFFKAKLWQRPKKEGKNTAHSSSAPLRLPQTHGVSRHILALLLLHPALLQEAQMEDELLRMECQSTAEDDLRVFLIDMLHEEVTRETLSDFLHKSGLQEASTAFLHAQQQHIPKEAQADAGKAKQWLHNLKEANHLVELEEEYKKLEQECAGGVDSAYPRLLALQQEIQRHQTQRLRTYFEYTQ